MQNEEQGGRQAPHAQASHSEKGAKAPVAADTPANVPETPGPISVTAPNQ